MISSNRTETYERTFGPLHLWQPKKRHRRPRAVTIPESAPSLVKLVFGEMARQGRRYDDIETASGVRRASIKAWRRKNKPGLESLEAVLNVLGFDLIPVPAFAVLPTEIAPDLATLSTKLETTMPEAWAAIVSFAASQQLAREAAARKLAAIDAAQALH